MQSTTSNVDKISRVSPDHSASAWSVFTSTQSDEIFCRSWLTIQCSMISGITAGILLLHDSADDSYVPASTWPDASKDLSYLGKAAEKALTTRRGTIVDSKAEEVAEGSVHVAYPLETDGTLMGVVALDLANRPDNELQEVLRQLLWGTGWLEAMFRRNRSAREILVLERAATGLDLVQAAQEQDSVVEAAMALANEIATRLNSDRVSLGLETDGKLRLRAISRTAWFDRKSRLVEGIENAMEESMDQEASVVYPALEGASARVLVAQRDLALRSGASSVLTVPLVSRGRPVGAITLERYSGPAFDMPTLLICEVFGELLGSVLESKLKLEHWLAGRAVERLVGWRDKLLGPRWPTFKLGALTAFLVVLFLAFAEGDFRVTARTVIEGQMQRAAVSPFDGFIASAVVRAGDEVSAGQVLATLDDREIKLEHARWESQQEEVDGKYREALANRDATASRIFAAQRNQVAAQLALANEKLVRTQVIAPIDSVVVWGDLSQMIGAPVERGEVLFELAPRGAYRIILQVDDRDIGHVAIGQTGQLALAGLTGETLPFQVESVTSVSTPQDGRNYFRVEAAVDDVPTQLQPGMEGVAKIHIEERKLLWIWTRNFTNWLRLTLWNWLP